MRIAIGSTRTSIFALLALGASVAALPACGGRGRVNETDDLSDPSVAGVEGELHVMISDHDDLTTQKKYFLGIESGDEVQLLFDALPAISGGMRLRVNGTMLDPHTWHVDSF